jgi:hypothetical protein
LSILGDVPQRNGLSRRDGQVRNDAVGLDLWSADLRSATDQAEQPLSWERRQEGDLAADSGPRLVGRPSRAAVDALALSLSAAGAAGGG